MPFLRGLLAIVVSVFTALVAMPTAHAEEIESDYPVVMAVGDIACDPNSPGFNKGLGTTAGCRQQYVGDMVTAQNPDAFLALGDIQYHDGRMDALMQSYDKAFGTLKDRTYPVPGDHDYLTANGADYYKYFGDNANQQDKGTYAYRMGDWLILAINTINCSPYYPCGPGSQTERFIAGALAANPARCVMAYWHHPIWSAGEHGNFAPGVPVWNQLHEAGVDVVLTGNNHLYQRFRPLGPAQAGLHEIERGNVHIEPLIHDNLSRLIANRNAPAQDFPDRAVSVEKPEHGFVGLSIHHRLGKFRNDPVSVFRMNSPPHSVGIFFFRRVQSGEQTIVPIAEDQRHPSGREDAERSVVDDAPILGFRTGQVLVELAQVAL